MKKYLKIVSLIITLLFCISNSSVFAEENNNEMGGYTIEGIPNQNQIDPSVGYFYLHENPGSKDELKVKLTNSSSKDKTLEVKVTDANTNINGIIDYTGQIKNNKLLKLPLTSVVKASEEEVIVPKNSSIETSLMINMPDKHFDGVIVGGIVVSEKKEDQKQNNNLSVGNTYSYTIGVVLTNEDKINLKKNVSVELENVGPILFDGRKIVQADILNPNPYIFSEAAVSGQILYLKNNKIISTQKKENISIAPYSSYPFQFDWNKKNLEPGKYLFTGEVKTKEKTWKLEKEFEITESKAKTINKESVFKVQVPSWLKLSCLLLAILSIVNVLSLLFRVIKRKKEMNKMNNKIIKIFTVLFMSFTFLVQLLYLQKQIVVQHKHQ